MEDMYGNKECVFSATMKLLSRAYVKRTISKQEAMCLLGQLPLILCSERIEPVSRSPSKCVSNRKEAPKDKTLNDISWVTEYEQQTGYSKVFFHRYVTKEMKRKNARTSKEILPHCTGPIKYGSFPILASYCYQVLRACKPWSKSKQL
jgi:hypothetical protein